MKSLFVLLFLLIAQPSHIAAKNRHKLHGLKLKLSSAYSVRIIDSVWLEQDANYWKAERIFDIKDTSINYHYDSLATGNYTFWIRDIFGRKHKQEFRLYSDTLLPVAPILGYTIADSISLFELQQSERIAIVYILNGCFAAHKEMLTLTKEDRGTYKLILVSEMGQQLYNFGLEQEVIKELFGLQLQYKEMDRPGMISTTRIGVYIVADNRLFQFSGYPSGDESNFYRSLKTKYLNRK